MNNLNSYPKYCLSHRPDFFRYIRESCRATGNHTNPSLDLDTALPGSAAAPKVPEDTSSVGRAVALVAHSWLAGCTLLVAAHSSSLYDLGSLDEGLSYLNSLEGQRFCGCQ